MATPTRLAGYSKYVEITQDHDLVPSAQSAFIMPVTQAGLDATFWSTVQSDGRDVRFTLLDGTLLNHEVAAFNYAGQTCVFWVQVPTLLSSADNVFYLQFGNASATMPTAGFQQATWTSDFKLVWHFETAAITDSTSNGNQPTTYPSATGTEGLVGSGMEVNGTTDLVGNSTSTSIQIPGSQTVTLWNKPHAYSGAWYKPTNDGYTDSFYISSYGDDMWVWRKSATGDHVKQWADEASRLVLDAWNYIALTYDQSTGFFTSRIGTTVISSSPWGSNTSDTVYGAAGIWLDSWPRASAHYDELWVRSGAVSDDRLTTEYNSQSNAAFYAAGATQSFPSSGIRRFNPYCSPGTNPGWM